MQPNPIQYFKDKAEITDIVVSIEKYIFSNKHREKTCLEIEKDIYKMGFNDVTFLVKVLELSKRRPLEKNSHHDFCKVYRAPFIGLVSNSEITDNETCLSIDIDLSTHSFTFLYTLDEDEKKSIDALEKNEIIDVPYIDV